MPEKIQLTAEEKLLRAIFGESRNAPRDVAEPEAPDPHKLAELQAKLGGAVGTLTEREKKVLELRFSFGDGYSKTLEEVGKQYRVTRERIRQIEAKALRKMRHPKRIKQLEGLIGEET